MSRPLSHLLPAPPARSRWPIVLGVCVALVVWCMVDVRRRARTEPGASHRTDFTVYTEAGEAFFDHRDPYTVTNPRGWHYLYPPLFALLVAPLAGLDSQWQAVVWFFLSAAMGFGCYYEVRRLLRALAASVPSWLGIAAAAVVALPTLNCMQRGQVGVAVVYFLLLGFRLVLLSGSWFGRFAGGVVLALPVAIKLTPALPVALLVGLLLWEGLRQWLKSPGTPRQVRAWPLRCVPAAKSPNLDPRPPNPRIAGRAATVTLGTIGGGLLFFLLIPAALIGWDDNINELRTWVARVAANDDVGHDNAFHVRSLRNQSLTNGVYRLGNWVAHAFAGGPDDLLVDEAATRAAPMPLDAPWFGRLMLGVQLGLVGLLCAAGVRLWRDGPLGEAAAFGLACAATLLVSPLSWGHHYTVLLPAAVFVPLWLLKHGREGPALVMAVVPVALSLLHYCLLDYAGRAGVLGIGTAAWFVVACGFALREAGLPAGRPDRAEPGGRRGGIDGRSRRRVFLSLSRTR